MVAASREAAPRVEEALRGIVRALRNGEAPEATDVGPPAWTQTRRVVRMARECHGRGDRLHWSLRPWSIPVADLPQLGPCERDSPTLPAARQSDETAVSGRHLGGGFCALTSSGEGDSCSEADTKGSWVVGTLQRCLARCAACAHCNYISHNRNDGDCSWFRLCPRLRPSWSGQQSGESHQTYRVRSADDGTGFVFNRSTLVAAPGDASHLDASSATPGDASAAEPSAGSSAAPKSQSPYGWCASRLFTPTSV